MKIKKKLGEMLVEGNLLTGEQLKEALSEHKRDGMKLGQFLVRKGLLNENNLVNLLSSQLKIEKYHPAAFPVDITLPSVIPHETAQKYQIVPLKKRGRLLTIAMTDPLDINALDSIEVLTDSEVEPVVCTEHEFNQIMNSLYGMRIGIKDVLEGIEGIDIKAEPIVERDAEKAGDVQIGSIQDMADEVPVVRLVNSIFSMAVKQEASDIHISPQQASSQVRIRIDGKLHEMPAPPKSMLPAIMARIKILANMDITVTRIPQDGRFTLKVDNKEINIRASAIPTIYGENMVLRLLETSANVYKLESLGMVKEDVEKIEGIINKPYGMILSTGPTGCGKSTSLYAILNAVNKPDIHIITIEDPVEYRVNNIRQVQLNKKAGMTFASGLRSILRHDPDVIMVGEIRDAETAIIAVQAALTGHRMLSTIHTNDAAGAIIRLIDMGIEPFLVSSVLLMSFAQRLVRVVCPYCKESYKPPEKALAAWGLDNVKNANFQHGKGCYQCLNTGYRGRTGVFEVLVNDEMVQDMILKRRSSRDITREAVAAGKLRTLKEDAAGKVIQGITTLEEAASAVMV